MKRRADTDPRSAPRIGREDETVVAPIAARLEAKDECDRWRDTIMADMKTLGLSK
jgi:hypothetical protein